MKEVTEPMVSKINSFLTDNNDPNLCAALESFVAILRNKNGSRPSDVEIYFGSHAKLISKMNRMETRQADQDVMVQQLEALEKIRPLFREKEYDGSGQLDLTEMHPFVEYGINFCKAALIDLKIKNAEDDVRRFEEQAQEAEHTAARYERLLQNASDLDYLGYFDEQIANMERRLDRATEIAEIDTRQATQYQQKLWSFERDYFQRLFGIAKEVSKSRLGF